MQLWAFAAVIVGLGFAYFGVKPNPLWLIAIAVLVLAMRKRNVFKLILIIVLAFGLGLWRGGIVHDRLSVYEFLFDEKMTITAKAQDDANYNKYKQLSFNAGNLELEDGTILPGKILVSGYGSNSILQGDIVQLEGKLRPAYGTYVAKMSYAQINVIEHHPELIAEFRRSFVNGMNNALPEPASSFAMGILVGQRATLPESVKQDLLMVGLTHIIAVSGYNLTIILRASKGLLAKQSKRLSLFLSIGLIVVFLLITGSSASIVRASIVSMLSIWALYYGRNIKPLNLIALAAAITAWANPLYVWADMGWYLSFLAFYGVLVLAPLVATRLKPRLRNSLLVMIAVESICAEVMTLPYVLHNFEQLSLVGLPANVLVVALIPLAMLLSLFAGLTGMFVVSIAGWIAFPAKILITYMLDVAHILGQTPHGFIENIAMSQQQMISLYILILIITSLLWFKIKPESGTITDKNEGKIKGAKV